MIFEKQTKMIFDWGQTLSGVLLEERKLKISKE